MPSKKPRRRRKKPPAPGVPILELPPGRRRRSYSNAHPADPEFMLWRYLCGSTVAGIATTERIPAETVRVVLTASGVSKFRNVNESYYKLTQEIKNALVQPPDFYTWRAQHRAELQERARQAETPPASEVIKLRQSNGSGTEAEETTAQNNNPSNTPGHHDPKEPPSNKPPGSPLTPPLER